MSSLLKTDVRYNYILNTTKYLALNFNTIMQILIDQQNACNQEKNTKKDLKFIQTLDNKSY